MCVRVDFQCEAKSRGIKTLIEHGEQFGVFHNCNCDFALDIQAVGE